MEGKRRKERPHEQGKGWKIVVRVAQKGEKKKKRGLSIFLRAERGKGGKGFNGSSSPHFEARKAKATKTWGRSNT